MHQATCEIANVFCFSATGMNAPWNPTHIFKGIRCCASDANIILNISGHAFPFGSHCLLALLLCGLFLLLVCLSALFAVALVAAEFALVN